MARRMRILASVQVLLIGFGDILVLLFRYRERNDPGFPHPTTTAGNFSG